MDPQLPNDPPATTETPANAADATRPASPSPLDELQQSIRALFPDGKAVGAPLPKSPSVPTQRFNPGSIQDTIVRAAEQHNVPPALMLALGESESSFNPNAVSPTGPRGLFQFTRKTAAAYGVDPDDPASSAQGAAAYMSDLLKQTGGDTEAALKLYKGFAQGGASQKHINHALGLVTKYGGMVGGAPGITANGADVTNTSYGAYTSQTPTTGQAPTPPRVPTDTQTPIGTAADDRSSTPDLQSTIASRQAAPGARQSADNPELQEALRAQFSTRPEEPRPEEVHDITSLSKLIGNLGYQGALNRGPNAYPATPKFTEPKGPFADRGPLEPAGEWVNRIDTGIANSSPLAALQGIIQSLPGEAVPLRGAAEALNTVLGDVPQALLPKTFEKVERATTSGNAAVDWLVNTGSQGLGFVGSMMIGGAALDAADIPIQGAARSAALMGLRAAPANAIQVAMGEKNPISALVDVAVVQPTVGALFHGASTIASTPARIAASGAASGAGYVAGQAIAGEPVTLAGVAEAFGVGGIYGVAGGGHADEAGVLDPAVNAAVKKAEIDTKAHEAATSPTNDRPAPTPAQQDAGNYKMGHLAIRGLDISIENPQGSIRSGVDHNGEPWSVTMQNHYGYIRGTKGVDGDHIDAFIGPYPNSNKVFVVDQLAKPATETEPSVLDEHKVILGAHTRDEAEQIYRRNYSDDATQRMGAITEASMPEFKQWLDEGDTKLPFNKNMRVAPASSPVPESESSTTNANEGTTNTDERSSTEAATSAVADTGTTDSGTRTRSGSGEATREEPREATPSGDAESATGVVGNDNAIQTEHPSGPVPGSDRTQRAGVSEGVRADREDRQSDAAGSGARGADRELASGSASLRAESLAGDEGQRQPITLHDTGREVKLRTGDTKLPVKYALVESRDIQLSHDEQTFAENPNYAGENQNRYDKDLAQQAAVIEGGQDLDFDILHSTTSSSTEGPTVIDRFGQAAGGNGRGMMEKRAYASKPEETKIAVVADAAKFGLDPRKAAEMERPTIVRVQPEDVNRSVESRRNVSAQNQTATKQRTPAVDGVDLSKRLTPENKLMLSEGLADVRSLADLTDSAEKAKPIIRVLRDAGQITKANQNEYITPEATLTPKGRETVEGMTMGLIVPDAELIGKLPDSFRQKLGENLRTLGSIEATPGWELHDNLARVTDYVEARRAFIERGGVKSTFDTQGSLLSDAERPPSLTNEDRLLLTLLEDPKRTKFKEFMQSYAVAAADARAGETDLSGEVMTRDRAFREAEEAAGIPPRTGLGGYFDATKEADEKYIKDSLSKLGMNLDPELALRMARRGAAYIYDGAKDLGEYAQKMIDEFGERVRDDIAALYVHSKAMVLVNAGEGMRGTVRELSEAYHKKPEVSDFKRIAGDYTGSVQMLDHDLIQNARALKSAIPDLARREAIGNYIQAGGDEKLLLERAAKSAPKYAKGYADAAGLTPEEKAFAEASRARQEQNGKDAVDAGLMESLVDNYLHGEYVKNPEAAGKLANMAASGYFDANPSDLRSKIYDTYFDAEQAGLTPKDKDFARLVIGNERALKVAALAREAVHSMLQSKERDGLPTVVVGGAGHLVESDEKTAPFLVMPNAGLGTDMSKYKYFDHPALRKWKWIGTDSGGKPVLMQGDMWIHKDAYSKMTGLLGRSKIRNYTIPASVPVIGGRKPVGWALDAAAFVKGTIMLGPFHQFNVDQHALYHAVSPFNMPEIDFAKRPLLAEGVTHGLMLVTHGPEGEFNDVMAAGVLHHIPVVGDQLKRYQSFLFQEHIPKLKALTFEKAFTRAEARYAGDLASGKISRDQLLDIVANQSNAMYGELNPRYPGGSVLHNPTVRDVARLAFLAPDFLEARMKSLGQAMRPYGHEQRMALLRGALVMGATAQITNLLIGDDHKMHWDRPFSVIVGGREYSARSEVADLAHLVTDPRGFWYHRLNPLWGRPLLELAEGRDMNGDKVGIGQAAQDILKSWTPIPAQGFFKNNLGGTAAQSIASAFLGSGGISSFTYRTDGERFIAERARAKWSPEKPSADAMELFAGKSELRDAFRRNAPSAEIAQIKTKYGITSKQASRAMHDARQPPIVLKAERLTVQELADAFDHHLNAEELRELAPLFARKLNAANDKFEMPEEEKNMYRTKYGLTVAAAHAPIGGPSIGAPAYGMPVQ